jgi:hypothetical protein
MGRKCHLEVCRTQAQLRLACYKRSSQQKPPLLLSLATFSILASSLSPPPLVLLAVLFFAIVTQLSLVDLSLLWQLLLTRKASITGRMACPHLLPCIRMNQSYKFYSLPSPRGPWVHLGRRIHRHIRKHFTNAPHLSLPRTEPVKLWAKSTAKISVLHSLLFHHRLQGACRPSTHEKNQPQRLRPHHLS